MNKNGMFDVSLISPILITVCIHEELFECLNCLPPVGDSVLVLLAHLGISLIKPLRLKAWVPAKVLWTSGVNNFPRCPAYEQFYL